MYSMIIIDDESIIRVGLKKFIEKSECGFSISEVFEDGKEAIEYLKSNHVDLVLTDICMVDVNGLEVAKFVQDNMPDTEVVILSGYRNFEYAQEAIAYGVTRYLVKPVKNAEIIEILKNAKQCLDEKKRIKNVVNNYDEMLNQIRNQFFVDYMLGASKDKYVDENSFKELHFECDLNNVYAAVLQINWPESFIDEGWKYGKDSIHSVVLNFLSCHDENIYEMSIDEEQFLVLTETDISEKYIDEFKKWAEDTFNVTPYIQLLYSCKGIDGLKDYKKINKTSKNIPNLENERRVLLCTYLNLGMYEEARGLFLELLESSDDIETEESELIKLICDNASKVGVVLDYDMYMRELRDKKNSKADVFDNLCKYFKVVKSEDALITKIKEYVHMNYAMDISLESVSDKVYLHPVYLSRFFKQHVGENFRDYLLSVRMTNAIILLKKNSYKIYEICQMVGYNNRKYFSKQFKKYTGYTPKNYCKMMWNINVRDE